MTIACWFCGLQIERRRHRRIRIILHQAVKVLRLGGC